MVVESKTKIKGEEEDIERLTERGVREINGIFYKKFQITYSQYFEISINQILDLGGLSVHHERY